MWCYACSWDVRGDLTLNSMAADSHFCPCAYVTWSRVDLWSAHVPARLSNFCCRTHFLRRDVRVKLSSDVTSCLQKRMKCLLKKCANGPFYMTPSHQIIEISIWEPTHRKGLGRSLKIKRKFYVSSRDVRIVCPRLKRTQRFEVISSTFSAFNWFIYFFLDGFPNHARSVLSFPE